MAQQLTNGEPVEVVVIAADGTPVATPLTPRELWTVEAVERYLRTNAAFTAAYPEAKLVHVDSMRGVDEHRHGRYYLRYHSVRGVTECWGYLSRETPTYDLKKGVVGVVATPETPENAPR